MAARQVAWHVVYEALARWVRTPEWAFMNYGYAGTDPSAAPRLGPADEPDRLAIQLYAHVVSGVDVTGKEVLEVGSGRGGGSSWIARSLRPASMTGLELSAPAVELSRRHRGGPGLRFVQGDAQAMPFPDASFDVVVNVESSHCYGSMESFLAEVERVLRPGGTFVFADLRDHSELGLLRAQLDASGLTVRARRDITAQVLHALHVDDARRTGLIRAWIPRPLHRPFSRFAATEGSRTYARFQSGALRYVSARLTKPPV